MGYEQINLNFESEDKKPEKPIISYSEREPKPEESEDDYVKRMFELNRAKMRGEVIFAEPTTDEINQDLQLSKSYKKKVSKNEIIKPKKEEETISESTQKKIDQMKSRKDLDY